MNSNTLSILDIGLESNGDGVAVQKVIEAMASHCPELLDPGTSEGVLTRVTIDAILSDLRKGTPFGEYVFAQKLLRVSVQEACELRGWRADPIPQPLILRNEKSRHTPITFRQARKIDQIVDVMLEAVGGMSSLDIADSVALSLLALVIFGGITDKNTALKVASVPFSTYRRLKDHLIVEVCLEEKSTFPDAIRLWWVPALCRSLFLHVWRLGNVSLSQAEGEDGSRSEHLCWEVIRDFLASRGIAKRDIPRSFASLCRWANAWLSERIPYYLADYASWRNPSYSPAVEVVQRLVSRERVEVLDDTANDVGERNDRRGTEREAVSPGDSSVSYDAREDEGLIRLLNQTMRKGETDAAEAVFKERSGRISPILAEFSAWCLGFKKVGLKGSGNSLTTAHRYFRQLARPLATFFHGAHPSRLNEDEFEAVYNEILWNESTIKQQGYASRVLLQFHRHLEVKYGVAAVDFCDLDGFVAATYSVNTNFITPGDYSRILQDLWVNEDEMDRDGFRCCLITVLGFRLGLRRSEVRSLRLRDLRGKYAAEIRVLESKSHSGRRWLPLRDLLTSDELDRLLRWQRRREEEGADEGDYLFANMDTPLDMPSVARTFDVIHRVMRSVCNDETLHYHVLRHSFASHLILCFEAARMPSLANSLVNYFDSTAGETAVEKQDTAVLQNSDTPTKKLLYQLAILIGHSSPLLTLIHYVHILDFVLLHWVESVVPRLTLPQIAQVFGYKPSRAYELLKGYADDNGKYDVSACSHLMRKRLREWKKG